MRNKLSIAAISPLLLLTASHQSRGFWQKNSVALIGLVGVLIATGFGFWQWRRSQKVQSELEARRLEWESRKIEIEDRVARDRISWEEQRQVAARRVEAEEVVQARLRQ